MSLPIGIWKLNVNGTEDFLSILVAPHPQGVFSARLFSAECFGLWDEASQTITFTHHPVLGAGAGVSTIALFKGYLFRSPPNPEPGRDVVATLTGFVQVIEGSTFDPAIGTARRNVFGWFAQIAELL